MSLIRLTALLPLWLVAATPVAAQDPVPYQQVQRVLDARCTSCHSGAEAARGLELDTWQHLIAGSADGAAVVPYDKRHSLLTALTTSLVGGPHPVELDADPLTQDEQALIATWVTEGARSPNGELPYADADQLLYVANQGVAMVSVIDMTTNLLIRTVDLQTLGFSPNAMPHHIVVEPDGSHWYLSLIAANVVLKFDRANQLVGQLDIELRDQTVALSPGEFFVVPRGVEHRPVAHGEVHALLFEPASTLNTGNVRNERTVAAPVRWVGDS